MQVFGIRLLPLMHSYGSPLLQNLVERSASCDLRPGSNAIAGPVFTICPEWETWSTCSTQAGAVPGSPGSVYRTTVEETQQCFSYQLERKGEGVLFYGRRACNVKETTTELVYPVGVLADGTHVYHRSLLQVVDTLVTCESEDAGSRELLTTTRLQKNSRTSDGIE